MSLGNQTDDKIKNTHLNAASSNENIERKSINRVEEWVKNSDFTKVSSPNAEELNNSNSKEYEGLLSLTLPVSNLLEAKSTNSDNEHDSTKYDGNKEFLPLINQNIEILTNHNDTPVTDLPFGDIIFLEHENCIITQCPSSESCIIEMVPNIEIRDVPFIDHNDDIILSESVDDDRDKDFDIRDFVDCASSEGSESEDVLETTTPLSEQIRKNQTIKKKIVRCTFCEEDLISKNFVRHLKRHHGSEKQVEDILKLPVNCKHRRRALSLLRKDSNFELYITGTVRPYRQPVSECIEKTNYYPCYHCKGLFKKNYLKRHAKVCNGKSDISESKRINHLTTSQTMIACASDPTETISKLNIKTKVFDKMKGDEISLVAKSDLLIAHFGESYLKKHRRERMVYACSNRIRELARVLIAYRKITVNDHVEMKELLQPRNFENVLSAARDIVGYDPQKKTFKSPSLAMHLGTSLKIACDELTHLILKENKGFKCKTPENMSAWLRNIKHFKKLIESRWNNELASLANKDLMEKRWNKPLLLPLIQDIKTFRDQCLKMSEECVTIFTEKRDDVHTYKLLVNCTLALLIVFNRRRIGDVQFLKIEDYKKDQRSNLADFENALTDTEKMLTTKYKRVLNSGKGSRAVVILVPEIIQNNIEIMLNNREKYIPPENQYVFAIPGSTIEWGKGDVAIRTLANKMNLENPQAISSNKLRKHIATVMQLLNLTKDEAKQFSTFMGHTQKTHEEFYELPIDLYQTAKVSKLLLMMEKGTIPLEHKGKSLAEINFDVNLEYAVENDEDGLEDGVIISNENVHVTLDKTPAVRTPTSRKETCKQRNTNNTSFNNEENDTNEEDNNVHKKKKTNLILSSDDESDHSNKDSTMKKGKKDKSQRKKQGWTNEEVAALKKEFEGFIRKRIYPSSQQIKTFIQKTQTNRSPAVIKSKLQHLIKLDKMKN